MQTIHDPNRHGLRSGRGATLLEALVVLVLSGLTLGIGARYLNPPVPALASAAAFVEGTVQQARAEALVSTSARRVRSVGEQALVVESAPSCYDAAWQIDAGLSGSLPDGVTFVGDAFSFCFDGRGIASGSTTVALANRAGQGRRLEVLRGGTLRWAE